MDRYFWLDIFLFVEFYVISIGLEFRSLILIFSYDVYYKGVVKDFLVFFKGYRYV